MNNFRYFTVLFAIVLLHSSVRGLQCLRGLRIYRNGNRENDTLRSVECSDPIAICHRYDVTATQNGDSIVLEQGNCLLPNFCPLANCEAVEVNLDSFFPGSTLDSCEFDCCEDDNCNHAAGLGFKSWMIVIFSLLAFGFSKFLSI